MLKHALLVSIVLLSLALSGCPLGLPRRQDPAQTVLQDAFEGNNYKQNGVNVEVAQHPSFSQYKLRIMEPEICDDSVVQYSGYLDISDFRHLFFWFFEARNSPDDAPLMLWLNGGPGASSIAAGLLLENGPCSISYDNTTVRNDYSWNEKLNIIYLDQPIGTGFSYSSDGSKVITLADVEVDAYAFLQVFIHRFPKYASAPFHLAGESFGGHYGPHLAHYIFEKNQELMGAPQSGIQKINLASVIIANGLTEPASQFETVPEYLCGGTPYSPYEPNDAICRSLRFRALTCTPVIHACYLLPSNATCGAAMDYCWAPMIFAVQPTGKNPYDLRVDCDPETEDGLCYTELKLIGSWLNRTDTKTALGVDPDFNFTISSEDVSEAFLNAGQAMLNSAALLPVLISNGVRLLAFAGDTDALCNHIGVNLWMSRLRHYYHAEFLHAPSMDWATKETGYHAGEVRSAGPGAGNVTFVRIFEAGHTAPYDQPEATLDMISRWVDNKPLHE